MIRPQHPRGAPAVVGIVVPARDEAELLPTALVALARAVEYAGTRSAAVFRSVIVLDCCQDDSLSVARAWQRQVAATGSRHDVVVLESIAGRVGAARRAGCRALLDGFVGVDTRRIWLASTDADSEVPVQWLGRQLDRHGSGADVWLGTVTVADHGHLPRPHLWQRHYDADRDPVHGASMGVSAHAYLEAGGFPDVATGEDRALIRALRSIGATVCHDDRVPVRTSARRDARAPFGMAHDLELLEGTGA